jgi:hypothetical protein
VLKKELAIPLIATAFIAFASATAFIALADPAKRTAWTWVVCTLAIALILVLNVYWFGIRPGNKHAAFALLERSGFIRTATDDPTLNETLSALCATPFSPKQVISACVLDAGRSRGGTSFTAARSTTATAGTRARPSSSTGPGSPRSAPSGSMASSALRDGSSSGSAPCAASRN